MVRKHGRTYDSLGKEAEDERTPLSVKHVKGSVKFRWRVLVSFTVLWVAYVLVNAAYSVVGPFFPLEALKEGSNSLYTGIIISCAPFSVVIFSPIFGYYLPVIGLRFSLLSGLFLVGGSYILMGFAYMLPAGWVFIMMCLLLKLIEGIGSSLFLTGALSVAPQYYPKSVGTVTGLLEAAAGLGYCIGPPIGGVLYAAGGFGLPFWMTGGGCLFLLIPSFLIIDTSGVETHCTVDFAGMWEVSSNFIVFLLLIAGIITWMAFGFIYPIFQPFLFTEFGLSEEFIGLVFLAGSVVYMLVSLFSGKLSDKMGPRFLIIIGFAVNGLALIFLGPAHFISSPQLWLTVSAYALCGAGAAIVAVPLFADLLQSAKHVCPGRDDSALTGVVSGLITSAYSLGQAVGPILGGALNHSMDFQSSALIVGEVLIAQSVLLLGVTFIDRWHSRRRRIYYTALQQVQEKEQ